MALLVMAALTVSYVSVVVYATTNSYDYANEDGYEGHRYLVYAAFKYEQETPPTEWYMPEELGIIEVWERNDRAVQIVVDREKEPFPFGPLAPSDEQRTRFYYKGEFYTVAHRWVTFTSSSESIRWEIPIGGALGAGWVFVGALFLKGRKKE